MFRVSNLALAVCLAVAASSADAFAPSFSSRAAVSFQSQAAPTAFVIGAASAVRPSSSLCMAGDDTGDTKSTLVRKAESSVEVTITAPASATKAAYNKACAEISRSMSIPGFRKGAKIPPQVIESQMAARGGKFALREQAISSLLNELIEPCLKDEHNLDPIGQPELTISAEEMAKKFKPGEPVEMTVKCDVWPDISWKEAEGQEKPYYGLTGSYKRKPFNQERFNKALSDLRNKYATTTPMEEGATLSMGDACTVNMVGYMAEADGKTKGDPLPNTASGDNVEIVLGDGLYMEGLVEGIVGAKVGDSRTVYVAFPDKLKDKTLAGKKAVFDVDILTASYRSVPEVTDEFAAQVRPEMTAESLNEELRKAIDEEDAKEFIDERNKALGTALATRLEVEVPDTLVTNQARDKYAMMMSDFREQGMADEEIKKMISPENFLKYKEIEKPDIVRDFKISMATDEIARLESIEVEPSAVDEQIGSLRQEAGDEEFDEAQVRAKVESTLQRRLVFDFLNEHSSLDVEYVEENENFDEEMMQKLADESLQREKENAEKEAAAAAAAASADE